jgi:NADH-quinone oxidoreductase subunit J
MPDINELMTLIGPYLPTLQQIVFLSLAGFIAIMALITVLAPNLFHNAMGLVGTLFGVAGIYALLEAEFLAVSQVLVYVGAISTLITFAIMLTRGMMFGRTSTNNKLTLTTSIVVILLFFVLVGFLYTVGWPTGDGTFVAGENLIADLGELFVTTYLVPFEMMALLLLVALAGAIMLARDH